jgi:putative transposase
MKKALKRRGRLEAIATDGLRSYPAAMRKLGNRERRDGPAPEHASLNNQSHGEFLVKARRPTCSS